MTRNARVMTVLVVMLLAVGCFTGAVTAEEPENVTTGQNSNDIETADDSDPIIDFGPITYLLEILISIVEDWDEELAEVMESVLFYPFETMGQQLITVVATVLTTTPSVHPNPAVEEVHSQLLVVTYLLATLVLMFAGILYMIGPVLGVSYGQVRMILPRMILGLVFAAFSLPLMQIFVDLTDALVMAFRPEGLRLSVEETLGLASGVLLAYVTKSILLLALVALFILRAIYILFIAAISPLLALMWSIPKFKRYADTFIAGWFAALLIAPLDLLVLNFALAMMEGDGVDIFQSVSNWILGIASLILLLLVPYQVWTASQTIVGQTYRAETGVRQRIESRQNDQITEQDLKRYRERRRRRRRRNRGSSRYDSFNSGGGGRF